MSISNAAAGGGTLNDRVTSLPGIGELTNVQFAGYSPIVPKDQITDESENLFYWFVGTEDYENSPTVIWTNGGPGSSSFWGFFTENGPYEIIDASPNLDPPTVKHRPWAWNNKVNYMIFEHPLSVTLSFAKNDDNVPKTPQKGAEEYYNALQNFLDKHPEIRKNKIILAGESYAGTYLPLIANNIYLANKNGGSNIDLASVVLLDAWVDPKTQMTMDTQYAYGHGLISKKQKAYLDKKFAGDKSGLNWAIHELCGMYMTNIAQFYDPPFGPVYDYINRDDVRKAIHVDPSAPKVTLNWSKTVSDNYAPHIDEPVVKTIDTLLDDAGFTIQVINGLNDAKDCNFLGTEAWLETLTSSAAKKYHEQDQKQWRVPNVNHVLGFVQDGGQLSWVKVLNAGHMAVGDQPAILDIILEKAGVN
ncbi:MAG: hypothetical protein AAGA77_12220 [Bacteroidota bacterium]